MARPICDLFRNTSRTDDQHDRADDRGQVLLLDENEAAEGLELEDCRSECRAAR